ncbi:hypothetical protein BKA67DRAFT_568053 [Truncatella angustata]|uniref:Zn(2)-C6 fungal-type domain-containing protein n=1 Tax=Truncatella angustata TaxID=152316 RepID=A0A9P8UJ28_9PEZI|nr:uncharacterized protein BKA67DRAFT_568053 [Truncatella angustata]KAH6652948.1 hypothetical protein BKA67DRAFT_568053 [Truncatella angustata]
MMGEMSLSRRSHPKSRQGCKICKSRKVKCDETRPACRNCVKHNVECDFLTTHTPRPSPSLSNGFGGLNMADLELLHNYSTTTCISFSESDIMREYYRINVVQMAFRNEYIMRTLLAISALHIAHHRKQSFDYYVSLAMAHHQAASRTAMELMTNITSENAPMLFLFSNLTMFFGM